MRPAQSEFMRGWTVAARIVTDGYDESYCQALCAYVPPECQSSPDAWRGFVSAMISGYNEEAQ